MPTTAHRKATLAAWRTIWASPAWVLCMADLEREFCGEAMGRDEFETLCNAVKGDVVKYIRRLGSPAQLRAIEEQLRQEEMSNA